MAKCYFELREKSARGSDSSAADMMRHLHTRQHLGKAAFICDKPYGFVGPTRKQWHKLTRLMQRRRSATLNADKILKYTHAITRMQHMGFSNHSPLEESNAEVYFLQPDQTGIMPVHCYTVYILTSLDSDEARTMVDQLPADALIVDYTHQTDWQQLGLQPKQILEKQVSSEWAQVEQFLTTNAIDPRSLLLDDAAHSVEAMDDALDTLLSISHRFMRIANEFQRAMELARPLRLPREKREQYDALVLIAHRVQALSPGGAFTQHFLESYNEDDTFLLYDSLRKTVLLGADSLQEAVMRHRIAGRLHLARGLQEAFVLR